MWIRILGTLGSLAALSPGLSGMDEVGGTTSATPSAYYRRATVAAPERHKFIQYNVCGVVCNEGGSVFANDVANLVLNQRPLFVSFNEICRHQLRDINVEIRRLGLLYDWSHKTNHVESGCDFGNGVLWITGPPTTTRTWFLPSAPDDDPRSLICVFITLAQNDVACSTHLSPRDEHYEARSEQIKFIQNIILDFHLQQNDVLVGGDFNQVPADPQMDPMYPPTYLPLNERGLPGLGFTEEVEGRREGLATTVDLGKLDYVFMTPHFHPEPPPTVFDSLTSDHHILIGYGRGDAEAGC